MRRVRERKEWGSGCRSGSNGGRLHIVNHCIETDELGAEASEHFRRMVNSVGVKRFADVMSLSTRQINRMLSGAQPNPVERIIRCLQSCEAEIGDDTLSFICQEAGGFFVKDEGDISQAGVNAVKECAEAIAAISDGHVTEVDETEVRDAICALTALLRAVQSPSRGGVSAAPALPTLVTTRRVSPSMDGHAQTA